MAAREPAVAGGKMTDSNSTDEPDLHHEQSDVNVRAIFGFGLGLVGAALVIHLGVWLVFRAFDARESASGPLRALAAEQTLPPEPRLQVAPRQDLKDLRAQEDEILNSYRWVDKGAGVVRIPISEAMRLIVQRGLPTREATGGPNSGP